MKKSILYKFVLAIGFRTINISINSNNSLVTLELSSNA